MKVVCWVWAVLYLLSGLQVSLVSSKRDKGVYCSVCRALVDEINVRVSAADPKKKIQVGSYRVDPKGNQKLAEVKYATSDLHLTEILEDVCQAFNDYAVIQNQITKREGVVRTKDRSGKELDASNVRFSAKLRETFKSYCEEVIEETEDEIMTIFKQDNRETIEAQLCGEISGACTEEELLEPVPKLQEKRPPRKLSPFHKLEPEDGSPRSEEDDMESLQKMREEMAEAEKAKQRAERAGKKIPPENVIGGNINDEL
ncbi:protein canopy homolog 2-like [Babylonia areolata]|uniref:protein canopy homolog 2-like n=1 Tax=Babylonia areolata TaxID=304850 RepID=UPI003FD0C4C6